MMKNKYDIGRNKMECRRGATIIEIMIFLFIVQVAFGVTYVFCEGLALRIDNTGVILIFGVIIFILTVFAIAGIAWIFFFMLELIFPSSPEKCESKRCKFYPDCKPVRIGLDGSLAILYFKCNCGYEYLEYSNKFFAKVNPDGSMQPWKKRTFFGWRKDNGSNSFVAKFRIPNDMLERLRQGTQNDVDVDWTK